MAHPDMQIIPRFACSLENRGTCRTKPKNPYPPLQQCCRDSRYPGPPLERKIPKPFPGRYPNSRAFRCDVVEKSRWFGFDVADYFSSSPTLEIDTLSHIPQRGVPVGLAVEYSRRHLSARADTITLSLHHLFFFVFFPLFTYVFH